MLGWHWAWMWNTCSGWMELKLTLLSIRRTSPYLPLHHNLNHSLPFRHFSSLLLFFLLLPNLGGVGVAGLKLRGLWVQYDWAQVRGWAAIGWLMGGQAASSCPHLPREATAHPTLPHSPQGFHQKRNQLGPRPLLLLRMLQSLASSSYKYSEPAQNSGYSA